MLWVAVATLRSCDVRGADESDVRGCAAVALDGEGRRVATLSQRLARTNYWMGPKESCLDRAFSNN